MTNNTTHNGAITEAIEALAESLGAMTGGMDGKWSEGVDAPELARKALAKLKALKEVVQYAGVPPNMHIAYENHKLLEEATEG